MLIDLPEIKQLNKTYQTLWTIYLVCFFVKEISLVIASAFALAKARSSQNAFASRVILGLCGTNVATLLTMGCLLLTEYLQVTKGLDSTSRLFDVVDTTEIVLEAVTLFLLATTAWILAFQYYECAQQLNYVSRY